MSKASNRHLRPSTPGAVCGPRTVAATRGCGTMVVSNSTMEGRMRQFDDLSRSLVALDQNAAVISVVELSLDKWLVGAIVPGITRDP
jgi:hypothetical protein